MKPLQNPANTLHIIHILSV